MIKVLVADDQAVVRDGLRVILDATDDLEVVGAAEDGEAAIALTERRRPDVVLMDVRMPRLDGIEATRRILDGVPSPPKVLVLSTFGEDEYVYGALSAGASGFLLKDAQPDQIRDGVRAVAAGDRLLAPSLTCRLIEEFVRRRPRASGTPPELADLTERELEVTRFVAHGLSNGEIAGRLVLSPGTIKTHVAHVLQKTGLRDRIQLVVLAYESGLVEPGRGSGQR